MKLKTQKTASLLILGIGLVLLVYMVTVEGEPGALPLLLILLGGGWYAITRLRTGE